MGKLWKHDIRQSLEMNRSVLILMVIIGVATFAMFAVDMNNLLQWVEIEERFTLGDALWYLHQGTNFEPSENAQNIYRLPVVRVFQMVLLHYFVGYYPMRDWENCGVQVLLRVQSRRRWWAAKVLWVLTMNLVFALLQIGLFAGMTVLLGGRLSLSLTDIAFSLGAGNLVRVGPLAGIGNLAGVGALSFVQELLLLVGMPFLVQTALCLLQLLLMFLIGPFWAFISVAGYEMAATCLPAGYLLANYTMCKRAYGIVPFYDWPTEAMAGAIGSLALGLISAALGFYVIKKKDILPKEGA